MVTVVSPPTVGVVTLVDAKAHLRVDLDDDDGLIGLYLSAATQEAETLTERSIGEQTLRLTAVSFTGLVLERQPVTAVTLVEYQVDGAWLTLADTEYTLDVDSGCIVATTTWPAADAVRVTYTAGYTAATCPEAVKTYILLRTGSLYEMREADAELASKASLPQPFAVRLLDRYRVWHS